jgi:hypothetical protein
MKPTHIVCAILACAPLTFEARAAASTEDGRPPQSSANVGRAADSTAPSRDASAKPEGTHDSEPTRPRARTGNGSIGGGGPIRGGSTGSAPKGNASKGSASRGRDAAATVSPRPGSAAPARSAAQTGVAQAGRGNADRLRSLLNARARGRVVRQPGRAVGSPRGAAGGPAVRGAPPGVGSAGQRKLAASNTAAPPTALPGQPKLAAPKSPASPAAAPRSLGIGGPHPQVSGRIGGPPVSRTTRSATIDGGQLRHKF